MVSKGVVFVMCMATAQVLGRELNSVHPSSGFSVPSQFLTAAEFRSNFQAEDFVFDLFGALEDTPGGQISPLDVANLPSLQGSGISQSLFVIDPCGINLPHIHPRATEIQTLIKGNNVLAGFVDENANRVPFFNVLKEGETTFYPQGLIHFQFNQGCEPVTLLSALNSEDPGVNTVLTNLFQDGVDVQSLATSFGINDVNLIEKLIDSVPEASPAEGIVQACLKKCYGHGSNPSVSASASASANTYVGYAPYGNYK
eukprot:TRINITY_DN1561_c4_g1_i1.p2 TRINITY_DN1561_c4_g1~~TRINITY_DN1561_c4_g1_i1.p2  ORF type:complete len:256 (-),score=37.89 TRINITY_DN1561_c4_g1_i1:503-1270(-)